MKKRIALAAAAALAGGLLVAAPASAAVTPSSFGADTTAVAGPANYVNVSVTEGGYASAFVTVTGGTLYDGSTTKIVNNDTVTVLQVKTPVNGIITLNVYDEVSTGVYSATAADSLVITVGPAPVVPTETYNHTTVGAFAGYAGDAYLDGSGALFAPKGLLNAPAQVATFAIDQYSWVATDDTKTSASLTKAVTVSLSGVGVLSSGAANNVTYLAFNAGETNTRTVKVSNDGRSGVATITVAVDGTVVKTKTVTFYGAIAKYTASINHAQSQVADSMILTVKSFDAAGVLIPNAIYNITDNESTTVGSVNGDTVVGVETYTVTASAKSNGVITVGNGSAETATVVAKFVTNGVASIVVTADKASYAPGEKATFSIVAKNSDGDVAGDASYTFSIGGSTAFYGAPASPLAVLNGAASFSAYMPVAQGPVIAVVTLGSGTATLNLSVVDPAASAQAAAITALQTSVATLTTTVASLVASMTAQIKVINATMLKIQKQLAALRAQVNKL